MGEEESVPEDASQPTVQEPSFDIDLGAGVEDVGGGRRAISFDLSVDAEPAPNSIEPPESQSDLPGPSEEASDVVGPPAPVSDQGTEIEIPAYSDEVIFDAIAPVLVDLAAEVRRSIEYFASRHQIQPDRIILCGGTAKLPHLDRFFTAELGIPTIAANPLKNVGVSAAGLSEEYLQEIAPVLPVGIGLAIRDMIGE